MMRALLIVAVLSACCVAQESPIEERYYQAGVREYQNLVQSTSSDMRNAIEELKKRYNGKQFAQPANTFDYRNPQDLRRTFLAGQNALRGIAFSLPVLYPDQLQLGQVGYLRYGKNLRAMDVISVMENGLLVRADDTTFIVEGVKTEGVVSRATVGFRELFEVAETRTYKTVLGTNTAFVLRALTQEETDRCMQYAAERSKDVDPDRRLWQDVSGKFQVEARYEGVKRGLVSLRKDDDTVKEVPLANLSKTDRQWIQERQDLEKLLDAAENFKGNGGRPPMGGRR